MRRRLLGAVAIILLFLCFDIPVLAVETNSRTGIMATEQFGFYVQKNSASQYKMGLNLESGETVTIKGSYSPFSASVKYGFIAPGGLFYGADAEDGALDYIFTVGKRGTYYFTVVNNSNVPVSANGYINYPGASLWMPSRWSTDKIKK